MEPYSATDQHLQLPVHDDCHITCGYLSSSEPVCPWLSKPVTLNSDPNLGDEAPEESIYNQEGLKMEKYMSIGPSLDCLVAGQVSMPIDLKTHKGSSPLLPRYFSKSASPWPNVRPYERHRSPDTLSSVSYSTCPSEGIAPAEMDPHYSDSSQQSDKHGEQSYREYLTYQSFGSGYARQGGRFVAPNNLQQFPVACHYTKDKSAETKAEPEYAHGESSTFHGQMQIASQGFPAAGETDDPELDAAGETDDDATWEPDDEGGDDVKTQHSSRDPPRRTTRRRSAESGSTDSQGSGKRLSSSSKQSTGSKNSGKTRSKKTSGVKKRSRSTTSRTAGPSTTVTSPPSPMGGASGSRTFPCPFARYDCQASFSAKNEWKRHVMIQHLRIDFWRCDLCPPEAQNDFNRKDLYTQHLRRMHMAPQVQHTTQHPPASYSATGVASPILSPNQFQPTVPPGIPPVTEDLFYAHQARCYRRRREPPYQSECLFCTQTFAGSNSWDERMEHVGRHLDQWRKAGEHAPPLEEWREDPVLEQWLLDQGLIHRAHDGSWKILDGNYKGKHGDTH